MGIRVPGQCSKPPSNAYHPNDLCWQGQADVYVIYALFWRKMLPSQVYKYGITAKGANRPEIQYDRCAAWFYKYAGGSPSDNCRHHFFASAGTTAEARMI